ncbi:unnamed protein product [Parascedosporium putredinis]|uniref:DNA mismatch repair proteins mutS family domain-containing protein n=1 Tax=Parascedosporium putredinis TaxID=1442378 RepID=A0A9P1H525_9PEZI|nr:unnamed protein product [Parascedosporium putredinis]CAI7997500.1 unnamed protein product [Parascedosporium putredinis]
MAAAASSSGVAALSVNSRRSTPFPAAGRVRAQVSIRPETRASSIGRPSTSSGRRSQRAMSIGARESEEIICALSEGRGIPPTVGLCFVNLTTGEVTLSHICDNQFYVRTVHKLQVYEPSRILILATACPPYPKSTLYSLVEEHVIGPQLIPVDRRYWSEAAGLEHIRDLATKEDAEAVMVAVEGNYYTTCSFAAIMAYLEAEFQIMIHPHSLRVQYQPSEDTVMVDISTIHSLELMRNIKDGKVKGSLYGVVNATLTPMGARMLRCNLVQPSTLKESFWSPDMMPSKNSFRTRRCLLMYEKDILAHVENLKDSLQLDISLKFDNSRLFYLRIKAGDLEGREVPAFVPNDYYATPQYRFQMITGPNMSGKSTYIRAVALLQIMAQIGSFVPADYAAFRIVDKIFARVTTDDCIESNLSSFSVEMREMAFILQCVV